MLLSYSIAMAQLNPMGSAYFFNPYLSNPAMCGPEDGMQFNAAIKGLL